MTRNVDFVFVFLPFSDYLRLCSKTTTATPIEQNRAPSHQSICCLTNMETEIRAFLSNKRRKLNPESPTVVADTLQHGIRFHISGYGQKLKIECVPEKTDDTEQTDDENGEGPSQDSLELDLGAGISKVAVLESQVKTQELRDRVFMAVACADLSLRLISYPIRADISQHEDDLAVTTISENVAHQDYITALGITHRTQDTAGTSLSRDNNNGHRKPASEQDTVLYIASASQTGVGLVTIHSVRLGDHVESGQDADYELVTRHMIKCSAMGSILAFKPQSPNIPNSPLTLLLTSPNAGLVKLYELPLDSLTVTRAKKSPDQDAQPPHTTMRPLVTLKVDFVSSEVSPIPRRKHITDAAWLSHGRAVVVILEDETYGVWDLEGVCPTARQNLVRGQNAVAGLTGGSTSRFAMKGSVKSLLSQSSTKLEIRDRPVTKAGGIFSNLSNAATVRQNEYDIGGLDQMLDSMESNTLVTSHGFNTMPSGSGDDLDIDMTSPSLQRSNKSRLTVNRPDSQTRQKLFG